MDQFPGAMLRLINNVTLITHDSPGTRGREFTAIILNETMKVCVDFLELSREMEGQEESVSAFFLPLMNCSLAVSDTTMLLKHLASSVHKVCSYMPRSE